MIRSLFLLFTILSVAACAEQQVRYINKPVRVEMPVLLPCPVTEPPRIGYATDRLDITSTDFEKIKALLVERKERSGMEYELRELLTVCISR